MYNFNINNKIITIIYKDAWKAGFPKPKTWATGQFNI